MDVWNEHTSCSVLRRGHFPIETKAAPLTLILSGGRTRCSWRLEAEEYIGRREEKRRRGVAHSRADFSGDPEQNCAHRRGLNQKNVIPSCAIPAAEAALPSSRPTCLRFLGSGCAGGFGSVRHRLFVFHGLRQLLLGSLAMCSCKSCLSVCELWLREFLV